MKKLFFLSILLLLTTFLFSYDIRGFWCLNTITPVNKSFIEKNASWGKTKLYKSDDVFFIDSLGDELYIEFRRWGKIKINKINEDINNSVTINFVWNNYDSFITFGIINNYEIFIEKIDSYFNFPNGTNKRFFKLEGPNEKINYPLYAKTGKDVSLISAGGESFGIIPQGTKVLVVSISNNSNYYDDIENKEITIQIDEKFLKGFNSEIYTKQNLIRKDTLVYGRVPLNCVKLYDEYLIQ